jgi:O-acetylhomoserine/O-acetylserine sulfhydrylase-like pyridoxal-dependent enzyme
VLDIERWPASRRVSRVRRCNRLDMTSPWLIKPFDHGADLVYHSTKV